MCTVQIVSGPRPRNPKAKRTKTKVKSMKSQNTNQAGPLAGPAPEAAKSCLLTPPLAFARVAQCLVRPKTNSPSPAQRSVHAGARKANSYYFISSRLGLECLLQPGWPDTGYGRRRWRDPTVERSLQEALVLLGHVGVVECLAFSADGNHLVSGDNTGVVRLWHAPSVQEISRNERGLK